MDLPVVIPSRIAMIPMVARRLAGELVHAADEADGVSR